MPKKPGKKAPLKTAGDPPLVAQLKVAVRASGRTHYAIAKEAGIAASMLDRFMAGESDIRLESAAKIAAAVKYSLQPDSH